jgi:hypothetical protein
MFLDPSTLPERAGGLEILEEIEKASLRMVTQAMVSFAKEARTIFAAEPDKPQDIAEDITREAMDTIGVSRIPARLFGTMDYKRARYVFHPTYAVRQALLVDSKAEKRDAQHGHTTGFSDVDAHTPGSGKQTGRRAGAFAASDHAT